MSMVCDSLCDRTNSENNTPAFCELSFVDSELTSLHVMLKGAGSDNASKLLMLSPLQGKDAIVREVVEHVREKAANACPPLVVGVGIGATFDKVAALSKKALLRDIRVSAKKPDVAELEAELLEELATYALAVNVETAPSHIAALPLAINLGCCAQRSISMTLGGDERADSPCSEAVEQANRDPQSTATISTNKPHQIKLPTTREELAKLKAGDAAELTGVIYTARDAAHERLLAHLEETGELPFDLNGQVIFYAGPTGAKAGRPLGSVGPTTASRMDFAAPTLYKKGIVATIGKGKRNAEVAHACKESSSLHFDAQGGVAALLAAHVKESEIVAYEDLGTEAIRKLTVEDFPVTVGIDSNGRTR
jgi:fumarate hydratase class I